MKKITKEFLQKVEGEAKLEVSWKDESIDFAKIKFLNFRGIEKILEGRPFLDALVITPRVCGICNTAHAIAAVNTLENACRNFGLEVKISQKALLIREFVLNMEKIQNHIKWFNFSILPMIESLQNGQNISFQQRELQKAQKICSTALQAGAVFSGQWPHGSFCMIGGVTCDPVFGDIQEATALLKEVREYCEDEFFGMSMEEYLACKRYRFLKDNEAQLAKALHVLEKEGFSKYGQSYDRFIAFGDNQTNSAKKSIGTKIVNAELKYVHESLRNSFFESKNGYTYSKSAQYKERYFESGPIARMMIEKEPLIRDLHRKFKDSVITRVAARVSEIAYLLSRSEEILGSIDISEPSYINPHLSAGQLVATGEGSCEAARGSLIHKAEIVNGIIKSYDIITPTVWNLGNGDKENPGVAQKAIMGLDSMEKADFVFKTFDVCAVCTTQ